MNLFQILTDWLWVYEIVGFDQGIAKLEDILQEAVIY